MKDNPFQSLNEQILSSPVKDQNESQVQKDQGENQPVSEIPNSRAAALKRIQTLRNSVVSSPFELGRSSSRASFVGTPGSTRGGARGGRSYSVGQWDLTEFAVKTPKIIKITGDGFQEEIEEAGEQQNLTTQDMIEMSAGWHDSETSLASIGSEKNVKDSEMSTRFRTKTLPSTRIPKRLRTGVLLFPHSGCHRFKPSFLQRRTTDGGVCCRRVG